MKSWKTRVLEPRALGYRGALVVLSCLAPGLAGAGVSEALAGGQASLDLRLRFEQAKQDGARDADALTSRLRLGYATEAWQGFQAFVEYEGIAAVGGDDRYNSGPPFLESTNGNTRFATVADPTGDEVNRAWLRYRGLPETQITLGRQRIILDDARFIGNVGWRQNEQTFDAFRAKYEPVAAVTLQYAYLWQQNFIFFNANELDAHLVNAQWAASEQLTLSGFAYFIDFAEDDGGPRAPGAPDQRVLGARAKGQAGPIAYALSVADQSGHAEAPASVDARYLLAELTLPDFGVAPTLGYELLGGDGDYAFQFPLATNHKFSGWADLFLSTPPDGLADRYLKLKTQRGPVSVTVAYHDFASDNGSRDYGRELDAAVAWQPDASFGLLIKLADYEAEDFGVDTRRLWVQLRYGF